jgi:HEPN domain-containing protein
MSESKQWLAYALDDLAYGELGMNSLPRAASWSFQQAAEKALKALLLAKVLEVPRTHDVAYLLNQLTSDAQSASRDCRCGLAHC